MKCLSNVIHILSNLSAHFTVSLQLGPKKTKCPFINSKQNSQKRCLIGCRVTTHHVMGDICDRGIHLDLVDYSPQLT